MKSTSGPDGCSFLNGRTTSPISDAWRTTGAELGRPVFLGLLAEVDGKAGKAEEGLALLAEALAMVDKTGQRYYEAELYRLKGELTLRMGERETGRTGEEEKIAHSPIHPFAAPHRRPGRFRLNVKSFV